MRILVWVCEAYVCQFDVKKLEKKRKTDKDRAVRNVKKNGKFCLVQPILVRYCWMMLLT